MTTKPDFIDLIASQGALDTPDAERVFEYYRRRKILKATASHGYQIVHGAYLDQDVITRALGIITTSNYPAGAPQ
jgi:hypothetical protein